MARTPAQAIAWGLDQVGKSGWDNLCLRFVRLAFGVDYVGDWPDSERDAGRAWDRAQHKHPTTDPDAIPRGVPVFWELNTEADHVALSLGDGWCLSNDFVVDGRIDRVRIADISARWGRLLGWTEDLVGNPVVPPQTEPRGLRVDGVDISHHQAGAIDYAAAKKAGVRWMYHKATEGATYVDPNYARRREQAAAAGIPFGAYHFARAAVSDAGNEARAFLAYATPKPGDLRPALDLETTEGLTSTQLRTWAATWIRTVEQATGTKPIVYTPYDLGESVKGCLIWRPRYPYRKTDPNRPPDLAWDIWQFSNGITGQPNLIAGFGHVDLNTMRKGLTLDDLLIPRPARKRRVTLGRFNLSINAVRHHPKRLTEELALVMRDCDSLGISEGGAAEKLIRTAAKLAGATVWFGEGEVGQASTPVVVGPHCTDVTFRAVPLTKQGLYIGKGAGPDHAKAKWLMIALFEIDGEKYADGNVHLSPSQYNPLRMAAALLQMNRAHRHMRRHYHDRHRSIGGDLNNVPGAKTFHRLIRWTHSTQADLGPEGTHGSRAIDDVYVDSTLRAIRHEARPTVSDHDAYLCTVAPKKEKS